jgi:hypothetical protein
MGKKLDLQMWVVGQAAGPRDVVAHNIDGYCYRHVLIHQAAIELDGGGRAPVFICFLGVNAGM